MRKKRKSDPGYAYCPTCKKRVPAEEKAGILRTLRGILMFFTGGAPGKRESQLPRCTFCGSEVPPP